MHSSLAEFRETEAQEAFSLQNPKLLKVRLSDVTVQAKLGSMVAYQGDVSFEHAGTGGVSRFLKKAVTGEGSRLMKASGSGELFLADTAQDVHVLRLENERITCNGANVLAFDAGIEWDIRRVEGGVAGALAGGLFNMTLEGSGYVALISDGPPVLLDVGEAPTFADPQAAITWSSGVQTEVKADVQLKSLIGRGSGESIQMGFSGEGWLLVQPSEGRVEAAASGGGRSGPLGALGG
ncbi:MAG: AIM24 family protein [Actinomycetota bacterium]|nr:AIM24 family protein [Actinomycetota bacterium]